MNDEKLGMGDEKPVMDDEILGTDDVKLLGDHQDKGTNQKKKAAKVVVPILILLMVAGIWFVKESQRDIGSGLAENGNPDFALVVTENLDFEKLKSYGLPILLDFGSESCPPCRELAPTIEKLNRDLQGKAIIKYMDVWESPELAEGYPIRVIPTLMFFDKEGNPYVPEDPEASGMILYSDKETDAHVYTTHEGGMTEEQIREILLEMGMEE